MNKKIALAGHLALFMYYFLFGCTYLLGTTILALIIFNLGFYLYFHRIVAHGQYTVSNGVHLILLHLYSMLNLESVAFAAATHVKHHKYSDTEEDPHSFRHIGIFNFILKNYDKEKNRFDRKDYARVLKNPIIKKYHLSYRWLSPLAAIVLPAITVVSFWLSNLPTLVVHLGSHNNNGDYSKNITLLFPLMWGDEMHKLHHEHPRLDRTSNYDILYYIGKALETQKYRL